LRYWGNWSVHRPRECGQPAAWQARSRSRARASSGEVLFVAGCSHYRGLCTLQFPQYRNACAERLRQVRAAWLLWLQDGAHVCPAQRW